LLYLREEHIVRLHSYILSATGGMPGIRLPTALGAITFDVASTLYYSSETIWRYCDIAALYADKIAKGHPFNDGNKRTAFASAIAFLRLNGYSIEATPKELENLAQSIVELVLCRITWPYFSEQLNKLIFKL
jgi:death on curing protein